MIDTSRSRASYSWCSTQGHCCRRQGLIETLRVLLSPPRSRFDPANARSLVLFPFTRGSSRRLHPEPFGGRARSGPRMRRTCRHRNMEPSCERDHLSGRPGRRCRRRAVVLWAAVARKRRPRRPLRRHSECPKATSRKRCQPRLKACFGKQGYGLPGSVIVQLGFEYPPAIGPIDVFDGCWASCEGSDVSQ